MTTSDRTGESFRLPSLLQQTSDPLFVLNPQRRILFVNQAWEQLTGLTFAEVRGQACRRRSKSAELEPGERILTFLAPTPEAMQGTHVQVRRRAPIGKGTTWEITFVPLRRDQGLRAILGIVAVHTETSTHVAAWPERLLQIRQDHAREYRLDHFPDESPWSRRIADQVRLAASLAVPVLLHGPAGCGKEWLGRTILQASSERDRPAFVLDARLLPAATSVDLLQSALERDPPGGLLLKHAEQLPAEAQELIARAGTPRLIVTSEASSEELLAGGRMVPALFQRVTPLAIAVPPLSQRREDFPFFVDRLLARGRSILARERVSVTAQALATLRLHDWPGNLRELYDVLFAALQRCRGEVLDVSDLPFFVRGEPPPPARTVNLDQVLETVERKLLTLALERTGNNKSKAAQWLGIWRARLIRRLEQLGLGGAEDADA